MSTRKSNSTKKRLYRVHFVNQGKVYEIYARRVAQSNLLGFLEVGDLVFGEKSSVVIDPSEERLKNEFEGVPVTYIPLHAVIRVDEVEKQGTPKIVAFDGKSENVVPYPFPPSAPRKG